MSDERLDNDPTSQFMSQDRPYQSRFAEGLELRKEIEEDERFYSFVWIVVLVTGSIISLIGVFLLCFQEFGDISNLTAKLKAKIEKPAQEDSVEKLESLNNVSDRKFKRLSPLEVEEPKKKSYSPLASIPAKMSKKSFSGIQRAALDGAKKCMPMRLEKALEMGASPNLRDINGETLLTWAIRIECSPSVEVLIAGGANVNLANKKGQRPMTLAKRSKRRSIYKKLSQAGAS